jgi:hypothetical protein
MRRLLVVLIAGSMLNAQYSALPCPIAHHADSMARPEGAQAAAVDASEHTHASGPTTGAILFTIASEEPAENGKQFPHDDDQACTLIAMCTSIALGETPNLSLVVPVESAVHAPGYTRQYATHYHTDPTPPPKLT